MTVTNYTLFSPSGMPQTPIHFSANKGPRDNRIWIYPLVTVVAAGLVTFLPKDNRPVEPNAPMQTPAQLPVPDNFLKPNEKQPAPKNMNKAERPKRGLLS